MSATQPQIPVFAEAGATRVFASALDWPGWARRAKTEELALAALSDYLPRYEVIVRRAGLEPPSGVLAVKQRHEGVAKNADFGSLGEIAPPEWEPLAAAEGDRLAVLLAASWAAFDETAASAPAELRKGPRGGGRDTAKIIEHVLGCDVLYARKMGVALPKAGRGGPGAPGRLRALIIAALQEPDGVVLPPKGWPLRYAARRTGWHVLDHLWEIEDKSEPA